MDIDITVLVCLTIALAVPIVLFLLWIFFAAMEYFIEKIRMLIIRKRSKNGIKMKRIKHKK